MTGKLEKLLNLLEPSLPYNCKLVLLHIRYYLFPMWTCASCLWTVCNSLAIYLRQQVRCSGTLLWIWRVFYVERWWIGILRGICVQDAFDHLCAERKGHLLGEGDEAHQGNQPSRAPRCGPYHCLLTILLGEWSMHCNVDALNLGQVPLWNFTLLVLLSKVHVG